MGADIEIDLDRNVVTVDGMSFDFQLSELEKKLTKMGGMTNAFNQFGQRIYDVLTGRSSKNGSVLKEPKVKAPQDVMTW